MSRKNGKCNKCEAEFLNDERHSLAVYPGVDRFVFGIWSFFSCDEHFDESKYQTQWDKQPVFWEKPPLLVISREELTMTFQLDDANKFITEATA